MFFSITLRGGVVAPQIAACARGAMRAANLHSVRAEPRSRQRVLFSVYNRGIAGGHLHFVSFSTGSSSSGSGSSSSSSSDCSKNAAYDPFDIEERDEEDSHVRKCIAYCTARSYDVHSLTSFLHSHDIDTSYGAFAKLKDVHVMRSAEWHDVREALSLPPPLLNQDRVMYARFAIKDEWSEDDGHMFLFGRHGSMVSGAAKTIAEISRNRCSDLRTSLLLQ